MGALFVPLPGLNKRDIVTVFLQRGANIMAFSLKRPSLTHAKIVLAGSAILAFLGVSAVVVNQMFLVDKPAPPVSELPKTDSEADYTIEGVTYISTNKDGTKEWELTADAAEYFDDKGLIHFDQVALTFFTDEGHQYTLSADLGIVDTETQDFRISGNVVGISDDGVRFSTQSLQYLAITREAKTGDSVLIESPRFDLRGQGMILDLKHEKMYLLQDVEALSKQELLSGAGQ